MSEEGPNLLLCPLCVSSSCVGTVAPPRTGLPPYLYYVGVASPFTDLSSSEPCVSYPTPGQGCTRLFSLVTTLPVVTVFKFSR